ncbi:Transcription-associated protein 1 [Psilocybe cubensis]|uniref:Transcription-associated protein 1 n=2 Tax=Psilocybe cubensis TaxID=181762 RepID=A0ACB8H4B2_PSICU|nr:Transcription-associated protein 1 [Psilocybe cubensis]KAH9482694.1 Transcription-associated protein 1 [Psilocybe cubensis]
MAAPSQMEQTSSSVASAATSDLDIRMSRIADPNIELRVRHNVACEIREILDTMRDSDSARSLPRLVRPLLDLLRSGEPSFQKESSEYQFRRVQFEILNRLPVNEAFRSLVPPMFSCMLHILRHDNEENGVNACKTMVDLIRNYRVVTEDSLTEFVSIFQDALRSMKDLVAEYLQEDSALVDSNVSLPASRSFKALGEMGMVMVIMSQVHRNLVVSNLQSTTTHAFEMLALESPVQNQARVNYEAMGGIWAGMSPDIKNMSMYHDLIQAQIKMLSYLAYVMRFPGELADSYGETLILSALRLLQDCPSNGIAMRKELMVVFRHLMGTPHRRALFNSLDKLFDEKVLLGTAVASQEALRTTVYTAVADLVHHVKNDLTASQLERIVHVYSSMMHNPAFGYNLHTLFAKMMFGLADVIVAKETSQGAARLLETMFETCLEKLEGLCVVQADVSGLLERNKQKDSIVDQWPDVTIIEKARPIGGAVNYIEKPEDILVGKMVFRTLLHGFRVCLNSLKKCDAPPPDGTLIFRFFEASIRCMSLFESDPRVPEQNEPIDWFGHALTEVNLHVFQEVWTHKIEFFFERAQKRIMLLNVCQFLFSRDTTSATLLAIVLRFLVDRLPLLGDHDDLTAAATIRLYKMAFGAVSAHPVSNEEILAAHVSKLLMDCFPLAAKATKPANYFHLLRALFRAIGVGGGRYEKLYNAVVPLLPDMLESLNRQLLATDGQTRDMIVELCLTVPLRLTHLLPHLTYLMQPLALALRGNPDLVSQGLRTLELCIDNLTPDFLDPTLSTVLRDLMEALFNHLKPLPAPHHPAHTTIRILGKLGGRNRRLLNKEPALTYRHHSESAKFTISFNGIIEKIEMGPLSALASRNISRSSPNDRIHAYNYLQNCLSILFHEGIVGRNVEETFINALEGIFDALHLPEVEEKAESFVRTLGKAVFAEEIRRTQAREAGTRPLPSVLLSSYLDAFPHALARDQQDQANKARTVIFSIVCDLVASNGRSNVVSHELMMILHQIANRFTALCLDDSWTRKSAGCNGIKIMAQTPDLGAKWITDRELDIYRTLLHILKDLPSEVPRDVGEVIDVLITCIRISNTHADFQGDGATHAFNKLVHTVGIFFPELQSPNPLVRQAAQKCIGVLVEISGRPAVEMLTPHRDRMLMGIYTKPLRALPFSKQIGMIEAIRYCVSLDPPLVELNDELLRLLHETLALADADDAQLLGPRNLRQGGFEVIKLRVACIKLLTAAMPLTDFFSRQTQTRQRVTSVYFKSLYSPSPEVKDVAHEGLRMVLTHQSRLPKELLQTGLRPILMNLADPKRLSVPGLEGLARLLELLTNYFKVEIGHKLLDHFRIVADPQLLQESSKLSLADNEGITKLVRLANIFHLLPSAANIFLEPLVNAIVQTEAQMHFSTKSPFSEPLARYLDRYPAEGIDLFLRHLSYARHLRTLRSILQAKLAPNLLRELASRTPALVNRLRAGNERNVVTAILCLFDDISDLLPAWLIQNEYAIDAVIDTWHSNMPQAETFSNVATDISHRYSLMTSIFTKALRQSPRIDLLFEIISIYTMDLGIDIIATTKFLYEHVALSEDSIFKRNLLMRFVTWFSDPSFTFSQKAYCIRYIISPTLLIQAKRPGQTCALIDSDFVDWMHKTIWQPMNDLSAFQDAGDYFRIEVLHLTTILVQFYPNLLDDVRKDVMRYAWSYITTNDDIIIKQTSYLLAARFFAVFPTPQKFILRAWTGLLRMNHLEGRISLRQEALAVLAPTLPKSEGNEPPGHPAWAITTRRLLAEESSATMMTIYHLITKQSQLFFPVRSLFVPHIASSLNKLGMLPSSTLEMRILSIDVLQVIFNWEEQSKQAAKSNVVQSDPHADDATWSTPLTLRENMVSYLVRLSTIPHDQPARAALLPKALSLLHLIVGPNGWNDVTVGLRFFSRVLENDIPTDNANSIAQALSAAKVLQVVAAEQPDSWYTTNAVILQKLIRKGLLVEEHNMHDVLRPIFDKLVRLYPLPKEEDEPHGEMSDFHNFIYTSIQDGLRNSSSLPGILGMLKSVVEVVPERIEPFSQLLMKLLSKLTKDHIHANTAAVGYDTNVRSVTTILDICQLSVAFLGDQRRWLLSTLCVFVDKSKSIGLCRYILDLSRTWALHRQEAYPTMKEKATLLQKMTLYESRGDTIFHAYLELVYDIYTEPSLRRSDLTNRLEQSFLLGCRAKDSVLRERFMDLFDMSVPRSLFGRLTYILGVQNWDAIADHNWIYLALYLILGAADVNLTSNLDRRPLSNASSVMISRPQMQDIIRPAQRLLFLDPQTAHDTWVSVFPAIWSCLTRREQSEITNHMVILLSKDYHIKQASLRPNVVQTLLTGIHACSTPMTLPPHLVKYLAKTYGAWHIGLEILEKSLDYTKDDDLTITDHIYDSLADVYAELAEEDMFYGLWRKRSIRIETNIGLAFEQAGMWEQAAQTYELAQSRVRAGTIPFSETEFCLWEDQWVLAAQKLQHWDVLYDFAKGEANQELTLECSWRIKDWNDQKEALEAQINLLPEIPTPRRRVFEAYMALLKQPAALDKNVEFTKFLEDAMQLSLRKWVGLPQHLSVAHIPLLQHFQQFVELQEAVQIFGSLSQTNAQNLEKKSSELKMVLQAWRERLPNIYDDINIWSDLVAWRQNVFSSINNAYMPLISTSNHAGANNANTFGYRGYHETAWIINRFAHVARKHELLDVCFNALTKIYTLPNIEISEAFLKLREQARAHYQKPNDLQAGLEVINNTNLMFFSTAQKAEFYTLKGMFFSRMLRPEDATLAFGQAVQLDIVQPKAWAEWGRFSDHLFKDNPSDLGQAANAVSCYMQAAGLYKSGKCRPLLARILWLLSLDDSASTISRAFDTYKGEAAYWFWITLIPQLCTSLSYREWKQARYLLLNLARHYPQAIFYHLRTTREEMQLMKKAFAARAAAQAAAAESSRRLNPEHQANDPMHSSASAPTNTPASVAPDSATIPMPMPPNLSDPSSQPRQASEHVDEILQTLKTSFPLLILSLETMVDQIQHKFKPNAEEEVYRNICMLLSDAVQNYVIRINSPEDDGQLTANTVATLTRMFINLPAFVKKEYEEDFITNKPTHYEYIQRLQAWRDKFEGTFDNRPRIQPLVVLSHYLTEFQYSKIDEIEVPGQYTEDKDSNQYFVRIQKFAPKFENIRSNGSCFKRLTIHGSDNSKTSFTVQLPCNRQYRREDKVIQMLRTFNGALARNKESRKRNLTFHLPAAISCSPNVRLYQTDSSYISLGEIYDLHCEERGFSREEPILFVGENVRKVLRDYRQQHSKKQPSKVEYVTLKKDSCDEVSSKMVPDDVLANYMARSMSAPDELWRMRKQFALQIASCSFMTYLFCLASRHPARFQISRSTGLIAMTELLPATHASHPLFATNDVVPFRLTPNMQNFLGPIFTEGLLAPGIMAIGRSLTEPEFDLEQQLCLLSRDEVSLWFQQRSRGVVVDNQFRMHVNAHVDNIVKRAESLACKLEREQALSGNISNVTTPVVTTVTGLISTATNPLQLAKMGELYQPWF